MATVIDGTTGVSLVQDGVVVQADLAANVAGNGPAFRAYATGTTSITSSENKVTLAGKEWDTANAFDAVTNSRFQPAIAGYYQLNARVQFASATYSVNAGFRKNGVNTSNSQTSTVNSQTLSDVVYLNGSTDYVELWAFSATTQNANSGANLTYFSGSLVRAA